MQGHISITPQLSPARVIEAAFARLDPVALGTAFGAVGALGLLLATTLLLLKGGPSVGQNLSLLGQYLLGFTVTWQGMFFGCAQVALGGFAFGYATARLRNWGFTAYAVRLRRRAAVEAGKDLLDHV